MTALVDSSALISLIDSTDPRSEAVATAFESLGDEELVAHHLIVAEAIAVATRRFGFPGAARLIDDVLPAISIEPVDAAVFDEARVAFRTAASRRVSFVDRVSFAFMAERGLTRVVALDGDFTIAGFDVVPE